MTEGILTARKSALKSKVQAERLGAIWSAMEDEGLDALIVAGRGLLTQYGYLEYVVGYSPLVRLTYAVVIPNEQPIIVAATASDAWYARMATDLTDVRAGGQGDVISKQDNLPQAVAKVLADYKVERGSVGLVGLKHIVPVGDYEDFMAALPDARISDATELVGRVKAIKSVEEQAEVLRSCEIADAGLKTFQERAAIGVTGWEMWGEIQRTVHSRGAREVLIMVSNDPFFNTPPRNERLESGDLVCVYVEITGPNGFWVEKASLFEFGSINDAKRQMAELSLVSHAAASAEFVVGSSADKAAAALEATVTGHDVDFGIWHGHGVGVDHDIPVITAGDKTQFVPGMVLALHPNFTNKAQTIGASVADTFIVQESGPALRGSKIDQKLNRIERTV